MLQAPPLDGFSSDIFSIIRISLAMTEIGGRAIALAFVTTRMIVVPDERIGLSGIRGHRADHKFGAASFDRVAFIERNES